MGLFFFCLAAHVILSFCPILSLATSIVLLCVTPKAGANAKKYTEKETEERMRKRRENLHELPFKETIKSGLKTHLCCCNKRSCVFRLLKIKMVLIN